MAHLSPSCSTSLFDVPPVIMGKFCELMDCSEGELGWRGLAERLSSDWRDFRRIEKYAEQGKSSTKELVWSWAHKNKTVGDLLLVLQEMGQQRAISLFREINVLSPVSLQEIKEGTKNFSRDFLIGEGQFFDVYKADIKNQSCVVKLLKQNASADRQKQAQLFIEQCQCLPRIQHPNVLDLLGYVRADDATCFVYPYLKHGSLFNRLHYTDKTSPLSWQVRYNILVGVAKAILHLHTMSPSPVICGNITSKNILLDQHFQPKLSDFAMVHLRSYLINHIKTIKMDHATLKFLGYLPEEYIRRGDLSVKTDVYSYGIIIMEVLSGYQAVVVNGSKTTFLREYFWEQMEKNGIEYLVHFKDLKTSKWPSCIMKNLLGVSIDSTEVCARRRPTMNEVLKRMENCTTSEKPREDHPKSQISIPLSIWSVHKSQFKVPVETDETMEDLNNICERNKGIECGQSEVSFLGNTKKDRPAEKFSSLLMQSKDVLHDVFLHTPGTVYTSRPVECSCSIESYSGTFCEECVANGFSQ
ncbi:interleukin-1 receptor-associated kinase 3 isoform X2 [Aquarana catesbeiana]|uniref:interleukin-1 receptor-associated kinase 3 isoform X2 n=1 Tax=Aquarana catesbeiana TaxID=8400 RepID=UPI003CC9AA74